MTTRVSFVELELGREPQFPFGERGRLYQLYLPLRPDGRVDTDAVGHCHNCCRGRRLRTGYGPAEGSIVLGPEGRLVLQYENVPLLPSVIEVNSVPLAVGESVPITEANGEEHEFQVISVRQV